MTPLALTRLTYILIYSSLDVFFVDIVTGESIEERDRLPISCEKDLSGVCDLGRENEEGLEGLDAGPSTGSGLMAGLGA